MNKKEVLVDTVFLEKLLIISRQEIRIGTLFRSIDFLLRTTGSQLRSTCV